MRLTQRVIIPKGLINPNETTIIELPEDTKNYETVIAKHKYDKTLGYYTASKNSPYGECSYTSINNEQQFPNELPILYTYEHEAIIEPYFDDDNEPISGDNLPHIHPNPHVHPMKLIQEMDCPIECAKLIENQINELRQMKPCEELQMKIMHLRAKFTISQQSNEMMNMLDIIDQIELLKMQRRLSEFQSARRNLAHATTNLQYINKY